MKRPIELRIKELEANLELAVEQERSVAEMPPDRRKYIDVTIGGIERLKADALLPVWAQTY